MSITIQQNFSLQAFNSMAIPAIAKHFARVTSIDELQSARTFAEKNKLPILVLGEGSNTLFEQDYNGLVVLNGLEGIELISENDNHSIVTVAAGEKWHDWVAYALKQGWYGLENLALIPGLVGASPIQNIGAYGAEVKDYISRVDFFDFAQQKVLQLSASDCQFAYRDSIFKHRLRGQGAIVSVTFRLPKKESLNLSYPALAKAINNGDGKPSAQRVFDAVCAIRSAKLPDPKEIPNAGSFFKNPIVSESQLISLKKDYPGIVSYPFSGSYKLAAGWLIDTAGWKGRASSGVTVHQHQALVIINSQKANGQQVLSYARDIQADVWRKFAVTLEIEPQIY